MVVKNVFLIYGFDGFIIAAALRPPADCRRPVGHPRTTWLRIDDE